MGSVVIISREALKRAVLGDIEADHRAIGRWLADDDDTVDFEAIAARAVPALEALMERGWVKVAAERRAELEATMACALDPALPGSRAATAHVVALVREALIDRDPPPRPRGPRAAEMALGVCRP